MAVDKAGNVYVADIGAAPDRTGTTVYKITPEGAVRVFATGFLGASGNAFDSKGNLFQSNLRRHSISKITPSGAVRTFVAEGIIAPVGIAIDGEDALYVANCGSNTIQKVTAAGASSRYAASELFNCPNGITLGPDGAVYVANFRDGRVLKVKEDGSVSLFADVPGGSNGHITYGNGTLYVVGRSAHQVFTLSLSGTLDVLAGSGARGHQDGAALEATFSLPNDLAVSPSGDVLYVNEVAPTTGTDNYPSVVRMIQLSSSQGAREPAGRPDSLARQLGALVGRFARDGFSGAVLVAHGDEVLLHEAYGLADRETGRPFTIDTPSEVMSVTKPFVATALLKLEAQGRLTLDDSLERYLGPFPAEKRRITIHDLLLHTAGFPASGRDLDKSSRAAFIEALKQAPLAFEPRAALQYSNPGYSLGAALVEEVSGQSFQDFLRQHVFAPAGMEQTAFTGEQPDTLVAVGYAGTGDAQGPYPPPAPGVGTLGATGIVSTVGDLYRWHRALQDGRVLPEASVQKFFTTQWPGHGYAWAIDATKDGHRRIHKDGQWPSYESQYAWYPDDDFVIIFTVNRYGWRAPLWAGIEALLFGRENDGPGEKEDTAPDITMLSFIETNGIRMRIAQQGDGPLVILLHGFPELWYAWRHQLPALAGAGYRAVAPDLRGFGETDRPSEIEAYDVLDLCGDVVGLIDALGEARAVLVGHDWGAAVAWYCALLEPARFTGLVTMSVPWGRRASTPPLARMRQQAGDQFNYMLFFQEPGVAEAELEGRTREFFRKLYATPGTPRDAPLVTDPKAAAGGFIDRLGLPQTSPSWFTDEDMDYVVAAFERTGFSSGLHYYRNLNRNWELTPHLAGRQIDVPTMFVAGDREFLIAGRSQADLEEAMRAVAPQVRVEILPGGVGHWLQQQRPDLVNARLIDFLEALPR